MKHQDRNKQLFEGTQVNLRLMKAPKPNQVRMIKDHPIKSRQTGMDLMPSRGRIRARSKPLAGECRRVTFQPANKSNSVDWDMVAVWAVAVLSFAALAGVGCVIWGKLNPGI